MGYCATLVKVLSKNVALYAYAVLLALLLFLPLMLSLAIPGEAMGFTRPVFLQNYASASLDLPEDFIALYPEASRRIFAEEATLRGAIRKADAKGSAREVYAALNDYFAFEAAQPLGLTSADEAAYRITRYLEEHPDSEVATLGEAPFLFHLPYALATSSSAVPFAVWYLAALPITLTLAGATKRHTLLGTAPLPGWRRFSTQYAAGCMAIIAVQLAAIAPSALFHLFQNGLGDPSYPLVFVREGELVESTALAAYLEALGMLVLGNLAILAAALGAAYLSRNGLVGAGVAVVLACVPLISDPGASTLLPEGTMLWLPTSYLDFPRIVGYPTVFPAGEASEIPLAFSSGRGLAVLAMWTMGLAGAFTLVAGGFGATRRAPRETEDETLCARDVRLAYGRHVVYDGADFALSLGQVAGFVAPNGWGKTTLMCTLSEQPLRGLRGRRAIELRVDGEPATDLLVRREVLYAASDAELLHPKLTVRDHLRIAKRLWGSEMDVREVAEALAIEDFLGRATRKLSQGMKQQVVLAVALISGARYVLLDEPTNGLDPTNILVFEHVVRAMAADGRGLLVSSHVMDVLDELADGVYLIRDHRLTWVAREGGAGSALELAELFDAFYARGAEPGVPETLGTPALAPALAETSMPTPAPALSGPKHLRR